MQLFKNLLTENSDFGLNCFLGKDENVVFREHSWHFFSCRLTSLAHCDGGKGGVKNGQKVLTYFMDGHLYKRGYLW